MSTPELLHTREHRPSATENPAWQVPPTPPPGPPPPPVDANVVGIILTAGGSLVILFDAVVVIDAGSPPTTWQFGGASALLPGGSSIGTASVVVPDGTVYVGDTAIIGGGDPAARTPEGGYVNGIVTGVSAG